MEIIMQTYTIALPILLSYIVWLLKEQKKERSANSKGLMLLLRMQLIHLHKQYMEQGFVTNEEYDNFMEIYEAYHTLKGNGLATRLKEEIENKLPIRT